MAGQPVFFLEFTVAHAEARIGSNPLRLSLPREQWAPRLFKASLNRPPEANKAFHFGAELRHERKPFPGMDAAINHVADDIIRVLPYVIGVGRYHNFNIALAFAGASHNGTKLRELAGHKSWARLTIKKIDGVKHLHLTIVESINGGLISEDLRFVTALSAVIVINGLFAG
jgi:hypothetical protein